MAQPSRRFDLDDRRTPTPPPPGERSGKIIFVVLKFIGGLVLGFVLWVIFLSHGGADDPATIHGESAWYILAAFMLAGGLLTAIGIPLGGIITHPRRPWRWFRRD